MQLAHKAGLGLALLVGLGLTAARPAAAQITIYSSQSGLNGAATVSGPYNFDAYVNSSSHAFEGGSFAFSPTGPGGTTTVTTITGGLDFTATAPMAFAHYGQSATPLPDGRVVIVGGNTTQTEIYDPVAATWTTQATTASVHTAHGAVLLPDGRILVVGGTQFALPDAELFDPATGAWSAAAPTLVLRSNPTATSMPDGSVMVCGGALESAGVDCETWW